MPSARSASWLNQGLSDTARHFPGLGILAQIMYPRSRTLLAEIRLQSDLAY
jgi:hypothetical protein